MPLIEELPVTQTHRQTHGWAYVPVDSSAAPIAAVLPGNRKRHRDGTITATATVKQQKAVQARLDSLDKENYKDGVSVPIPAREKGKREAGRKMTTNVRRILTYQRGFAHYLADEEALAAAGGGGTATTTATTTATPTVTTKVDGRRKDAPTGGARRGRPPASEKRRLEQERKMPPPPPPPPKPAVKSEDQLKDTEMPDLPATTTTTTTTTPEKPHHQPTTATKYDPKLDSDPLLRTTGLPKMPSARVMAALLAEPPLSYTAARARVSDDAEEKPVRRFCGVCGYWGRVKCRRCGEWTCGIMECWKGHEGVCVAQGMF